MVLAPWSDPIPLTRGWCVWELYCSIAGKMEGCRFEIALSSESEKQFVEEIDRAPTSAINRTLATIDCRKSECYKNEDLVRIQKAIEKSIGYLELMRDWVINKYSKSLETKKTTLGVLHPDSLTSMHNLAVLYHDQGKYHLAEAAYRNCLELREATLGRTHRDTLDAMNSLAVLYHHQGKYQLAESLHQECLDLREATYGKDDPSTITSMNNLARVYDTQGKYELAESMYQ